MSTDTPNTDQTETPRKPTLEVRHTFCDTHLDTRHVRNGTVGVGSKVGWRWRFLGVDMGTLPSGMAPMRHVLPWLPPIWSEVEPVETQAFMTGTEVEDLPHTLFTHTESGWVADVPAGWTANGTTDPDADRRMPVDGPLTLTHGDSQFDARIVEAPTRQARTAPEADPPLLATLSTLGFAGVLFAVATAFAPAGAQVTMAEIPDRFVEVQIDAPEPEEPEPTPRSTDAGGGAPGPSSDPTPADAPADQKAYDTRVARQAGILSGLDDMMAGIGDMGDLTRAADQLAGSPGGHGPRFGGTGRGNSLGGGGDGEGLDGWPGGRPGGDGSGAEFGYGNGPGGAKPGSGPITTTQDPLVIGSVNAADIDRVIRDHIKQIRYCYQRQLQRQPDLNGKVVAKFVIAKDGSVSSASVKSDSLGNPAVGQCVVGRIQRMKFVEPMGGGIAIVSYPFLFSPG